MARQYVAHDLPMRQRNVLRVPRLGREAKADRAVGRQPSRTGFQGPDADFRPLLPEGWRQSSHGFPPAAATDLRVRINVDPAVPAPPPTRSNVQAWVELSERSDHLTDALIYAGRGEWFDIYKAI